MQFVISFLEGIITFISPCLLPLLPVYISYFASGTDNGIKRTLKNAAGFIIGFTAVFVLLGALAGTLGKILIRYKMQLNIISGLILALFGLSLLGVINLKIFKGPNYSKTNGLGFFSSLIFGIIFAVSWTPCVGAFLGSALLLAANSGSAVKGIIMLLLYSFGLGIPFILSAVLIDRLKSAFDFIKRNYAVINAVCGGVLILIGLLMAIGVFDKILVLLS